MNNPESVDNPTNFLIGSYVNKLGFAIDPRSIMTVYSVPRDLHTLVFRVKQNFGSVVWKIHPASDFDEWANFNLLADHGYENLTLPHAEMMQGQTHNVLVMPYLGRNLADMKYAIHEGKDLHLGKKKFTGFTEEEVINLISRLRADHLHFAGTHGLLHADLGLQTEANNVTCRSINGKLRLLLVDAAQLRPASDKNLEHFEDEMELIEEWMLDNLLAY